MSSILLQVITPAGDWAQGMSPAPARLVPFCVSRLDAEHVFPICANTHTTQTAYIWPATQTATNRERCLYLYLHRHRTHINIIDGWLHPVFPLRILQLSPRPPNPSDPWSSSSGWYSSLSPYFSASLMGYSLVFTHTYTGYRGCILTAHKIRIEQEYRTNCSSSTRALSHKFTEQQAV